MATFASDYAYGTANESRQLKALNEALNTTLVVQGGFHTFDYNNKEKTIYAELKSRRINHNKYSTAIVGQNKVEYARQHSTDTNHFVFAFHYNDGLYAIEYDEALFATFEKDDHYRRGDRPDFHNPEQKVLLIPTRLLVEIA